MQEFTPDQKLMAQDAKSKLIAASTKPDGSITIVVEDGRKLTYSAEQVEQIKAAAAAKAEAKAETKGKGKK